MATRPRLGSIGMADEGVDEDRLTGMDRMVDGRRDLDSARDGLGLDLGVRHLLVLPSRATEVSVSVFLMGESSEKSKEISLAACASFPCEPSAADADMASREEALAAAVIVSTGCATMFPWGYA